MIDHMYERTRQIEALLEKIESRWQEIRDLKK